MGIRNKLVLCLLAVLFPLVAVGTFATQLVEFQMVERATSALANTQRLEAARIEQILEGYSHDARSLASSSDARDLISSIDDFRRLEKAIKPALSPIGGGDRLDLVDPLAKRPLQQLALSLQRKAGIIGSSIVELKIIDQDGETLGKTSGFSWTPADDQLILRSIQKIKTLFGDSFINVNAQQRLGLVSPITNEKGEAVGALIMESRLGPIINLISKHEDMGASIEAHIAQPTMQGDAQFITPLRFDRAAAFSKVVPASVGLPVNQALESPESQVIKALDYRGVESFLAIQTIADTGWGLIVKIDAEEAYAPVAKLRNWLLWATVASITFAALIYLFFLVPVARRLKRAAAAARQIMDGNLSARLHDQNNDEIAELATSINTLAHDLEIDQQMRSEVEALLRHQALHDELTGLLNRKYANEVIEKLTQNLEKEHSIMFLDLNGFKDVNDLYGHAAGDEVLKGVAERLIRLIPQGCTLARWGGDEFVVILPETNAQQATEFALVLHNVFDEPVQSSECTHAISCSIGLATSNDQKPLDQALLEADVLMYEQKKLQRAYRSKSGMATRGVERALLEDRVEMWFQPMVHLERPGNFALFGADTSLRIRNKLGGYLMAEEFMPDVKNASVSRELDERILDLSLGALRRWNLAGIVDSGFRLSISLTQQTLDNAIFPILLESRLQSMNIAPSQIQLELPEEPVQLSATVLLELQTIGIRLALNGVTSERDLLRHASSTQPSIMIVDRPFLNNMEQLRHMMDVCQQLQLDVMASHVETRDQITQLHALGITQFQGSLFGQPIRAVDFVSRWGIAGFCGLTGLGKSMTTAPALRLVG